MAEDPEINLLAVNQFDTDAFWKKITDLFHVRCIIKDNMTVSGTHDSNPWKFVEAAMNKAKKPGLTKLGVNYFYVVCHEHPDLDSQFQPFLDSMLHGDSDTLTIGDENDDNEIDGSLSSSSVGAHTMSTTTSASTSSQRSGTKGKRSLALARPTRKKTKAENAAEHQQLMATALTQSQDDMRNYMVKQDAFLGRLLSDADKKEECARLHFRFEIAKAMGYMDEMEQIMQEANHARGKKALGRMSAAAKFSTSIINLASLWLSLWSS